MSGSACYVALREIANRWSATLHVTESVSGSTTRDRGWLAPSQVTDHSAASSRPVMAKVVVAPSVGVAAYVLSRSVDDDERKIAWLTPSVGKSTLRHVAE